MSDTYLIGKLISSGGYVNANKKTLQVLFGTFKLLMDENVWELFTKYSMESETAKIISGNLFNTTNIKSANSTLNPKFTIGFLKRTVETSKNLNKKDKLVEVMKNQVEVLSNVESEIMKIVNYFKKHKYDDDKSKSIIDDAMETLYTVINFIYFNY